MQVKLLLDLMPTESTNANLIQYEDTINSVLQAIQTLNISQLYSYLDNEKTYQDMDRNTFIEKLKKALSYLDTGIDNQIEIIDGSCGGDCLKSKIGKGYILVGNKTRNFINLMFIIDGNEITDIRECTFFKAKKKNLELNQQFYIDQERGKILDLLKSI